jgi:hypothetical protein
MEETTVAFKDLKTVLTATKRIVKYHKEMTVAKGEHFNLFSVLNIETKENKTHSAFLAELLNPKGSHGMEDVFLKLFLTTIKHNEKFESEKDKIFESNKAFVRVERSVGAINLSNNKNEDPSKATGGRIDIYLRDKNNNIISIENKIHAIDQQAQIQRYFNYKSSKNTVYYLTLKGEDPSDESRLKLESGKHFFNISYRNDIISWLELCLKEVPNFTGLRESINQYILLLKKLNKMMNSKHDKELLDLMMVNIEESSFIANNFDKALNTLRHNFRNDIIHFLEERLNKEYYSVEEGKSVDKKISQLWIRLKSNPKPYFLFGVESFSGTGHENGDMFVGLISVNDSPIVNALPDENPISQAWRQVRFIKTKENNNINLGHNYTMKILHNKESTAYATLLKVCCNQIVEFVEDYEKRLPKELFMSKVAGTKN